MLPLKPGTGTQKGPTTSLYLLMSILHPTSCLLLQALTHLLFALLPCWAHSSNCSNKWEQEDKGGDPAREA